MKVGFDTPPERASLNISYGELKYSRSQVFAKYLDMQQALNKVRCYSSYDDFLAADEVQDPKGGIVIVETQRDVHPVSSDGFYDNKPQADWGDRTIIDLASRISADFKGRGIAFPIISNDNGIKTALTDTRKFKKNYNEHQPFHACVKACFAAFHIGAPDHAVASADVPSRSQMLYSQPPFKISNKSLRKESQMLNDWFVQLDINEPRTDWRAADFSTLRDEGWAGYVSNGSLDIKSR